MSARGGLPAAVLWDFDGSLMDTEPVWARMQGGYVRERGGRLPDDFHRHTVGRPLADSIVYLGSVSGLDLDPVAVAAEMWARMIAILGAGPIPWAPGARELVRELADAGVPQAVVSTSVRAYLDSVLHRLPDAGFAAVIAGDEVRHRKPHPEPYVTAARTLGVRPEESLVIEDSLSGVAAGLAAGCAVLAVPTAGVPAPGGRLTVRAGLAGLTAADLPALLAAGTREGEA
jgi:beta-phosphoglucomutase-like phosphatase (HAD superfamily)